jgi:serine/threonine-protein kinase
LIGKYEIVRLIGRGGFGLVYEARHLGLGSRVAIKVLRSESRQQRGTLERFRREAWASAQIVSAHVARVTDVDVLPDGSPFIVMELLVGRDLEAELDARGRIPIREAVGYALQTASAIAEAHARGVVHRDLKPNNLFLAEERGGRTLKVLDFGLSKMASELSITKTNASLGTPLYMSPEQLRSAKHVDARSDIWSLGVILYRMLALKTPFTGQTSTDVMVNILGTEPTELTRAAPNVPHELGRIVMKALRKQASERFQTIEELAHALAPFGPVGAFVAPSQAQRGAAGLRPSSTLTDSSQDTPATAPASRAWTALWLVAAAAALLLFGFALRARLLASTPATITATTSISPSAPLQSPVVVVPAPAPIALPPRPAPTSAPSVALAPSAPPPVSTYKRGQPASTPPSQKPRAPSEPNLGF